jgi:hypothetical protein
MSLAKGGHQSFSYDNENGSVYEHGASGSLEYANECEFAKDPLSCLPDGSELMWR